LAHYQQRAKELQNPDGSFSTEFFRKRGNLDNMQQRIYTTGHTVEWLAFSLPDADLEKAWVQDAVSALSRMILEIRSDPMESGAIYHAVHGLILYHTRVWEKDRHDPLKDIVPFPGKGN
jgi:mannose/cellobiose epimerase-like protein (N-acyl-D-glucosamine 2-epimerase family)